MQDLHYGVGSFFAAIAMDLSEIKGLVWEALARSKGAMSPDQVSDETGLEMRDVVRSLAGLRQVRLVEISSPLPNPTYLPVTQLDALRWAVALEEGIPLNILEEHASLAMAGRQEALRLATSGAVDKVRENAKQERQKQREEVLRGRAATKAAQTDVARIADDTLLMMKKIETDRPGVPPEVLAILRRAHDQAAKAVDQIARSLG